MLNYKKGVSLVTVLLFMLVATIAATATYKWLTSENRSSAARMMQRDAAQAAEAGIESARSWMTYNANDAGDVIRQYFANDPGTSNQRPAIELTSVLKSDLQNDQKFKVWLTGVGTGDGGVYKIKIMSEGSARNGSKHRETAIFNVTGLYQIDSPVAEPELPQVSIDYNFTYFGGSTRNHGNMNPAAMLINGDWLGNPNTIENNFIVTGNATLTGSGMEVKGTSCVGGNLFADNGFKGPRLYVAGDVKDFKSAKIDDSNIIPIDYMYVDGNYYGQGTNVVINNFTINGTMIQQNGTYGGNDYSFKVKENFCVGENGRVKLPTDKTFNIEGNVWIPGHDLPIFPYTGTSWNQLKDNVPKAGIGDNDNLYKKIVLGGEGKNVYITDGHPYSDYAVLRENKTFVERSDWRKKCSPNGTNANNFGEVGQHGGCYDGIYNPLWEKWGGKNYTAYVDVPSKPKAFYFYEDGINDVKFDQRMNDDYWRTWGYVPGNMYGGWVKAPYGSYFVGVGKNGSDVADDGHVGWNQFYNFGDGKYHYLNTKSNTDKTPVAGPYCVNKAGVGDNEVFRPECHVTPWFTTNGTLIPGQTTKPADVDCGESVKTSCMNYLGGSVKTGEGCPGKNFDAGTNTANSNYKVDDILVTGIKHFKDYTNKGCAADLNWDNNIVQTLNDCYANPNQKQHFYNEYLVVSPKYIGKTDPSGSFKGKFIFIFDETVGDLGIPPTKGKNDFVFLYLAKGGTGMIQGTEKLSTETEYNYFIYTAADMGSSSLKLDRGLLSGSVYAQADVCASLGNMYVDRMEFNQLLMSSLTSNLVICNYDQTKTREANESSCGGIVSTSGSGSESASGSGSEGEGSTGEGSGSTPSTPSAGESTSNPLNNTRLGKDSYYVAIAPQLSVSLETQHVSREESPSVETPVAIQPSIIVLPRIIYLPKNPDGRLQDYYSVLNLNGATENFNSSNVTCDPALKTSGALGELDPGDYTCEYKSSAYGNIPFYVRASSEGNDAPKVKLKEQRVELLDGETVKVYAVVPKSSHGQEILFDVATTDVPSGWNVVADATNLTPRTGSDGKAYYTVKVQPSSAADQDVLLFTISGGADAEDKSMFFYLSTPTEGCSIGSPNIEEVYVAGHIDVSLRSLKEYCAIPENATICSDNGYDEIKGNPSCQSALPSSVEWIVAYGEGTNCYTKNMNSMWNCKNSAAIGPRKVLPSQYGNLCEIVIPSENNSVTSTESPYLYGSAFRKSYTFTIDMINATNDGTKVSLVPRDGSDASTYTCAKSDKPCTFSIYAGDKFQIEIDVAGTDKFSYFKCSGENCPNASDTYTDNPFEYPQQISGDNTISVVFNKRDKCFYEDFSGMKAFCDGSSTKCIDVCNNSLDKGTACAVNNSRYVGSDWLMMYNNSQGNGKGGEVAPKFGSNYIYTDNDKNADNNNGTQSVILSASEAGTYGEMSAMFQTKILKKADGNDYLNSGMVFRSNGTEFLILNVFGLQNGNAVARICKVGGHSIKNYSEGNCKHHVFSGTSMTATAMVKVFLTLKPSDPTDIAHVSLQIGNSDAVSTDIDISSYNTRDGYHKYVGFDLSDAGFNLYDIGWQSSGDDGCWDYPTVKCSFKANYLGGRVPANDYVTPWVSKSSYFTQHNCATEYYYNGCDNSTTGCYSNYNELGFALSGSDYNFSETGSHGVPWPEGNPTGIKNDAKIKMSCPGTETSLDLSTPISCGTFWVGQLVQCSEDYSFIAAGSPLTGFAETELPISISAADGVNLRDATLDFDLDWNEYDANSITVYLESNGAPSLTGTISEKGVQHLLVENLANKDGFDPEHVTKIVLNGSAAYTVSAIRTSCPYALKVSCGSSVSFDAQSAKWTVSVTPQNAVNNPKCTIAPSSSNIETVSEVACGGGSIELNLKNRTASDLASFWNTLNTTGLDPITFDVTVTDGDKSVSCSPQPVFVGTSAAAEPSCEVSAKSVIAKSEIVPAFKFTLNANVCPSDGCAYTVTFDGDEIASGNAPRGAQQQKNATGNSKSDNWTAGIDNHTYTVSSYGKTCSASFSVASATEAVPVCSIDGDYLKISVSQGASYENTEINVGLLVNDAIGNPIYTGTVTMNAQPGLIEKTIPLADRFSESGTYSIYASGSNGNVKCGDYTVGPAPSFTCPSGGIPISDQDPNNAVDVSLSDVENCDGCTWSISGDVTASGKYSEGISFTHSGATGEKTYSLTLKNGSKESASCNVKVSYKTTSTVVNPDFECPASPLEADASYKASFIPGTFSGCNDADNCTYTTSPNVNDGSAVTHSTGFKFKGSSSDAGKTQTYKLTVSKEGAEDKVCDNLQIKYPGTTTTSCIEYVGGASGHEKNCFNSGLSNMESGACYKCNPDRGSDCSSAWLNGDASQSYWWVKTPCDGSEMAGGGSDSGSGDGGSGSTLTAAAVEVGTTGLVISCENPERPLKCACSNIQINLNGTYLTKTADWQGCDNFQNIADKCSDLAGKTLSTQSGTVKCKNDW